jgi:hypothetical protein
MKNYKTHPDFPKAFKHAENILRLPEDVLRAKLRERSGWGADRLPSEEELAVMILIWTDEENARRGISAS